MRNTHSNAVDNAADRTDHTAQRQQRQSSDLFSDEVGSEGGTPGDVELDRGREPGRGSEATELWQQEKTGIDEIHRDDTGEGGRSPIGG